MQLRVKHKGGQSVISNLTLTSSVKELLGELSKCTQIPANSVKVLRGFPPVVMDVSDHAASLGQCGLQERDTVLVEELPAEVKPVQATLPANSESSASAAEMGNTEIPTGILMRKVVPADNSCLFTSIGFCLSGILSQLIRFQFSNCLFKLNFKKIINRKAWSKGSFCHERIGGFNSHQSAGTVQRGRPRKAK